MLKVLYFFMIFYFIDVCAEEKTQQDEINCRMISEETCEAIQEVFYSEKKSYTHKYLSIFYEATRDCSEAIYDPNYRKHLLQYINIKISNIDKVIEIIEKEKINGMNSNIVFKMTHMANLMANELFSSLPTTMKIYYNPEYVTEGNIEILKFRLEQYNDFSNKLLGQNE